MEWVALVVAIVALVVAVAAVVRTRRGDRMLADARDALRASTAAVAELAAVERAQVPTTPWKLTISGARFTFTNVSRETLLEVALAQTNGANLTALQPMPVAALAPGATIGFDARWTSSSPSTAKVLITWHVGDGETREHTATLV